MDFQPLMQAKGESPLYGVARAAGGGSWGRAEYPGRMQLTSIVGICKLPPKDEGPAGSEGRFYRREDKGSLGSHRRTQRMP